jgi:hypothetical protein
VEHLRWIGFGAFFVSSLVIGGRLLRLARRSGQLPELLIAIGVLGFGPFGYGLSMLAFALASHSLALSATLMGSSLLASNIGAFAEYLFVGTVFRRGSRLAWSVIGVASALLVAAYVGDIVVGGLVNRRNTGAWYWLGTLTRVFGLWWCSVESLRYHRLLRRRERLGLADPAVTDRLLLWGLGSGAAAAGSAVGLTTRLLTGHSTAEYPIVNLAVSALGLVAAVAMWIAFLPPAAYLRVVARRGRTSGAVPSSAA